MANVNRAQNRQLRPVEGAAGMRIRLLGLVAIENDGRPVVIASKESPDDLEGHRQIFAAADGPFGCPLA